MVGLQLPWWTCSPSRHEGSKALPLPRASGLQKDLALALRCISAGICLCKLSLIPYELRFCSSHCHRPVYMRAPLANLGKGHRLSREHHLYPKMAPKQQEGRGVRRVALLQAVPPAAAWGPAEEPAEVRARPGAHTAPSLWVLQRAPVEAPTPCSPFPWEHMNPNSTWAAVHPFLAPQGQRGGAQTWV